MDEQNNLTNEKRTFGNYELIRRIDMGGMGEVYLAHQRTAFNREVAVKIIRVSTFISNGQPAPGCRGRRDRVHTI
jgi:hypothetical protein